MSEELKKDEKTNDRRNLIKKIVLERGFKGITALQKLLSDEHRIKVSRTTLYKDIAIIGNIQPDDLNAIRTKIVAEIQKKICELDEIANHTDDDKIRISAINSAIKARQEKYKLMHMMAVKPDLDNVDVKDKQDGKINIRFKDDDI
jgi:hypothetical protein